MTHARKAFTLIELLIVVAIIAILAAIAVPNFLEAQTRSKVSRAKTDMRSIATAVESYLVDHNKYAPPVEAHTPFMWGDINIPPYTMKTPGRLTTPVAYMTSLPNDVFYFHPGANPPPPIPEALFPRFFYINMDYLHANPGFAAAGPNPIKSAAINGGIWMMWSVGPDRDEFNRPNPPGPPDDQRFFRDYDATNGTTSLGNIFRTHRSNETIGYQPDLWTNP